MDSGYDCQPGALPVFGFPMPDSEPLDAQLLCGEYERQIGLSFTGCPITSKNPLIPSPLTGEGLGGGDKIDVVSRSYLITLPLIPSRQGRGKLVVGQPVNPSPTIIGNLCGCPYLSAYGNNHRRYTVTVLTRIIISCVP